MSTETLIAIIVAFLSSGAFTAIIQYRLSTKIKCNEENVLMKRTLAAVTYGVMSTEIERLLNQGYARPEERQTLEILFKTYKENGWNGDMDSRIEKVYEMPTKCLYDRRKGDRRDNVG